MGLDYHKLSRERDAWYQHVAAADPSESTASHHDDMMAFMIG